MGKNSNRKSLIRMIVNVVVHEIVALHTNRPESRNFLNSEVIAYTGQTEKIAEKYNWNDLDKQYVEEKAFAEIKNILNYDYPDVKYSESELSEKLKELIEKVM